MNLNQFADQVSEFAERVEVELLPHEMHVAFYDKFHMPTREVTIKDKWIYYFLETLDWLASYLIRGVQIVLSFVLPRAGLLVSSVISAFIVIPSSSLTRMWQAFKVGQFRRTEALIDLFGECVSKIGFSVLGANLFGLVGFIWGYVGVV